MDRKVPVIPIHGSISVEDWKAGIARRKAIGDLITRQSPRRKEGSDDHRLRTAFGGERAPTAGDPAPDLGS